VPASVLGGAAHADRIAHDLLEAAVRIAAAGGARLVQALLEPNAGTVANQLRRAGFQQVAELQYLVSSPQNFPTSPPAERLAFEPWSAAAQGRLESVVERSYVGTRDCPQLNGVRLTSEVLAGYRSAGPFDPQRWLLVRHAGQDVGCLLLVEHPQKIWELAYMGLTPEARGQGWGLELTRHGQWLARQAGASRFVLAVDATNAPALRIYAAAGLDCWDRRGAWLRILDPANAK
jgi:ribosomal protein S18 acetylase RimI-like enzyme